MGIVLTERKELKKKYDEVIKRYHQLDTYLKEDLRYLLDLEGVKYHIISSRIKEFDRFYEKVRRKKYDNPFEQNVDFSGFRIVCFYLSDCQKVGKVIRKNFKVVSVEDKVEDQDLNLIGYRSHHYVSTLKPSWSHPKFINLKGLKFEIQVRTLNMHSWSEASHQFDYKTDDFIPRKLRRKLYLASAFLEQVDEIFDEIKREIEVFSKREDILTIHSLKRYLEKKFPEKRTYDYKVAWLYQELKETDLALADIDAGYKIVKPHLVEMEKEIAGSWNSTGAARAILDVTSDIFFSGKEVSRDAMWYRGILTWRTKLKNKLKNKK